MTTTFNTLSFEEKKNNLRTLIEETVRRENSPVDYQFLRDMTGLGYKPFMGLLTILAVEDLRAGLATIDSLVTLRGKLMPSDKHFLMRIRKNFLALSVDWAEYHDQMIKRWCVQMEMDYHRYIGTPSYGFKSKPKTSKKKTDRSNRSPERSTLASLSTQSQRAVQFALSQPAGTFSFREMRRLK